MRTRAWPLIRVAFGLAGLGFLAVVLARTIRRSGAEAIPSWPALMAAGVLAALSLLIGSRAWSCLFEDRPGHELRRSFYASQLGKYIPGGIWQMVALVESGTRSGAGLLQSTIRFPVFVLTTIAAGGTIGAGFVIFGTHAPAAPRFGSLAGLLTLAFLDRRLIVFVLGLAARVTRRDLPGDPVPSQTAIITSYLFGLGTVLATSAAYGVLVTSLQSRVSGAEAITAFSVAWTVGFVAIPFPSGLGIREAVLIGVTASGLSGPIASAAVVQRIVVMVAELVMVLAVVVRRRARVA